MGWSSEESSSHGLVRVETRSCCGAAVLWFETSPPCDAHRLNTVEMEANIWETCLFPFAQVRFVQFTDKHTKHVETNSSHFLFRTSTGTGGLPKHP